MSKEMDKKLRKLASVLSPHKPIMDVQRLRGRKKDLDRVREALQFSSATLFIFGDRGVGKTSLAQTAKNMLDAKSSCQIYTACASNSRILSAFSDIACELREYAIMHGIISDDAVKKEYSVSANPGYKKIVEQRAKQKYNFQDSNEAIREIRALDSIIPKHHMTVAIVDELEGLSDEDRSDLSYFIKQVGDQDFHLRLMLVGIADNLHDLIGAHQSVSRYIQEVKLSPLSPQDLVDIVRTAAENVSVNVSDDILKRIAVIGNGYPHFAHLMGTHLLAEAIKSNCGSITFDIYKDGVRSAVDGSIQQLVRSYLDATQRGDDINKYLLWAFADFDAPDVRIDDWIAHYNRKADELSWGKVEEEVLRNRIQRLSQKEYGEIITNTPVCYGSREIRYRYKRFTNNLMRGHVRLVAESEGIALGNSCSLL